MATWKPPIWSWKNIRTKLRADWQRAKNASKARKRRRHYAFVNNRQLGEKYLIVMRG